MLKTTLEQGVRIATAHYFVTSVKILNEIELEITYKNGNVEIEIPLRHTPYGFYRLLTKQDDDFDQYEDDSFDEKMRACVDKAIS